jgi:hypothetical protein
VTASRSTAGRAGLNCPARVAPRPPDWNANKSQKPRASRPATTCQMLQ